MPAAGLHVPARERMIAEPRTGALVRPWLRFFERIGSSYGIWTPVPFAAGDFTGNGSMTWTVAAGDVTTFAYVLMGKLLLVTFALTTTTVGGTPDTTLRLALPAGLVAARSTPRVPVWASDNGTPNFVLARVVDGASVITFDIIDGSVWHASTNLTAIEGQIAVEVE